MDMLFLLITSLGISIFTRGCYCQPTWEANSDLKKIFYGCDVNNVIPVFPHTLLALSIVLHSVKLKQKQAASA